MEETKVPMGSWLGDLGAKASDLLAKAESLVEKYRVQAGPMLDASLALADAVRAFIARPEFDTAATLWHLIKTFPLPTFAAAQEHMTAKAECAAEMKAIDWGNALKFAELVASIIAKFVK